MKNLVVIRHAACGNDGRISEDGRQQMHRLFDHLHRFVNAGTVLVLTSSASRATDSAAVLVREFECVDLAVEIEKHDLLWSDVHHREDIPGALALLARSRDRADTIVVVTHLEYAGELPERFTLQESWPEPIPLLGVDRGQAVLLDCVNRRCRYLRP